MKLKVWMGIAVLSSLVIAAGTAVVAADDHPLPMTVTPMTLAADDPPLPMAPKVG